MNKRRLSAAAVGITIIVATGLVLAHSGSTDHGSPGVLSLLTDVPSATVSMSSGRTVIPSDIVHDDFIQAFNEDVFIEGTVTGEVIVFSGTLHISGTVESDVISIFARTTLTDSARIEGDLVNFGWPLQRHEGSRITGELVNISFMNLVPFVDVDAEGLLLALLKFFFLIKLALLAAGFVFTLITAALIPRRLTIIAEAMPRQWGWSILIGLLAWSLFFIAACIIAATILGLPLAGALGLAMWIVKWVGRTAIFFLVGQTVGRNVFRRELPHMSSILCGFLAYALLYMIPLIGGFVTLGLNIVGVGMVILTKFGAEEPWGQGRVIDPRPAPPAAGAATPPPEPTPPATS